MTEWKPIETAPKDGTPILLYSSKAKMNLVLNNGCEVDFYNSKYDGFGRFNMRHWPPSHWMLLPEPPKSAGR